MTTSNTYGRAVDVPMVNKSGAGVVLGDAVIYDTTNNDAFTTTTSTGSTLACGIAQETIANNGTGRIRTLGYTSLATPTASVTRGHYGYIGGVAKQVTDAGASRVAGTFLYFLTGGTTPDAIIYPVDLAGAALTNPMTTKGDIIIADTGGTPTRLAAGASGTVPTSAGAGAFETFAYPPGYEFDYVEVTSSINITATTEAAANTIVSGNAVSYDGSTIVRIEFFTPELFFDATDRTLHFVLYDGSSSIGLFGSEFNNGTAANFRVPVYLARRLTPSNASHTYSIRAYVNAGTQSSDAGAGGSGAAVPQFIRITKV